MVQDCQTNQGEDGGKNFDDGEKKKHDDAVKAFKEILGKYKVDLIVVCADSLESRKLKKCLGEFAKYQLDDQNREDDIN